MKKETYCLVCRKYNKSINPKIVRNRQNRSMIQSNCAVCGSKKSRFIKEHQTVGLLSNLGINSFNSFKQSIIIKYFVLTHSKTKV